MDYFASSPSSGGTSLVALNLNYGQKAVLKQSDDNKDSFIELNLEYARSWAAVDRALKEALITVNDLDRDQGIFFVEFSKQEEEKGFIRRMFSSESFKGKYQVIIKEVNENTCMVTIVSDGGRGGPRGGVDYRSGGEVKRDESVVRNGARRD